jgi:hypothetical protein
MAHKPGTAPIQDPGAYFGTNPHLAELLRSQTSVDDCFGLNASSES